MQVRIRLRLSRSGRAGRDWRQQAALFGGALLTPAAVVALALACWRLGADLRLTGRFAISEGLFSHWQVWLGVAVVLQAAASWLGRYGRRSTRRPPREDYRGGDEAIP